MWSAFRLRQACVRPHRTPKIPSPRFIKSPTFTRLAIIRSCGSAPVHVENKQSHVSKSHRIDWRKTQWPGLPRLSKYLLGYPSAASAEIERIITTKTQVTPSNLHHFLLCSLRTLAAGGEVDLPAIKRLVDYSNVSDVEKYGLLMAIIVLKQDHEIFHACLPLVEQFDQLPEYSNSTSSLLQRLNVSEAATKFLETLSREQKLTPQSLRAVLLLCQYRLTSIVPTAEVPDNSSDKDASNIPDNSDDLESFSSQAFIHPRDAIRKLSFSPPMFVSLSPHVLKRLIDVITSVPDMLSESSVRYSISYLSSRLDDTRTFFRHLEAILSSKPETIHISVFENFIALLQNRSFVSTEMSRTLFSLPLDVASFAHPSYRFIFCTIYMNLLALNLQYEADIFLKNAVKIPQLDVGPLMLMLASTNSLSAELLTLIQRADAYVSISYLRILQEAIFPISDPDSAAAAADTIRSTVKLFSSLKEREQFSHTHGKNIPSFLVSFLYLIARPNLAYLAPDLFESFWHLYIRPSFIDCLPFITFCLETQHSFNLRMALRCARILNVPDLTIEHLFKLSYLDPTLQSTLHLVKYFIAGQGSIPPKILNDVMLFFQNQNSIEKLEELVEKPVRSQLKPGRFYQARHHLYDVELIYEKGSAVPSRDVLVNYIKEFGSIRSSFELIHRIVSFLSDYSCNLDMSLLHAILAHMPFNSVEAIDFLYYQFKQTGRLAPTWQSNDALLRTLARAGQIERLIFVIERMRERNSLITQEAFHAAANVLYQHRKTRQLDLFTADFLNTSKDRRNMERYHTALQWLTGGDRKMARARLHIIIDELVASHLSINSITIALLCEILPRLELPSALLDRLFSDAITNYELNYYDHANLLSLYLAEEDYTRAEEHALLVYYDSMKMGVDELRNCALAFAGSGNTTVLRECLDTWKKEYTLNELDYNRIFKAMRVSGEYQMAKQLMDDMAKDSITPSAHLYADAIITFSKAQLAGEVDNVRELLMNTSSPSFSKSLGALLQAYANIGQFDKVEEIFQEIQEKRQPLEYLHVHVLSGVYEFLGQRDRVASLEQYCRDTSPEGLDPLVLANLIRTYACFKDVEKVRDLHGEVINKSVKPSKLEVQILLRSYAHILAFDLIESLEQYMSLYKIHFTFIGLSSIIKAYRLLPSKEIAIEKLRSYFETARQNRWLFNGELIASFAVSFGALGLSSELAECLRIISTSKPRLSSIDYNSILTMLLDRNMVQESQELVTMMLSRGIAPDAVTSILLTRLDAMIRPEL